MVVYVERTEKICYSSLFNNARLKLPSFYWGVGFPIEVVPVDRGTSQSNTQFFQTVAGANTWTISVNLGVGEGEDSAAIATLSTATTHGKSGTLDCSTQGLLDILGSNNTAAIRLEIRGNAPGQQEQILAIVPATLAQSNTPATPTPTPGAIIGAGRINFSTLPTSDPGDGSPWNNGGVVMVGE